MRTMVVCHSPQEVVIGIGIIIVVLFTVYCSILYMFVFNIPIILHIRIKWLQTLKLKGLKRTTKDIFIKTVFH